MAKKKTSKKKKYATNIAIKLQSGTTRTVFATWTWNESNTKEYNVKWYYHTGNGVWFIGTESTVTDKNSTYNAPENATKVKFTVKPISKTHKVKKKNVTYWTAYFSTEVEYNFSSNPPVTPSVPTVTIDKYTLKAEVDDYNTLNDSIEFYVVKNDLSKFTSGVAKKVTNHASFTCNVNAGQTYKVRCRAIRGSGYSDWSEYSGGVETIPAGVTSITSCKALSTTSVRVDWSSVANATSYKVEYTSDKDWFDSSNQTQNVTVSVNHAEITGLDAGKTWFFRVQAVNDKGESGWCTPVSVTIGKAPAAPTTWSSTATAIVGEKITLYWVHNSEDNSSQTYAELELTIGGSKKVITQKNSTDEDEKDKTSFYELDTSAYVEGTTILWRVRTKGILNEYSDWSIQREIEVHARATLSLSLVDADENEIDSTIESFPFKMTATAGPSTQQPIGYSVTITANESYPTVDYTGEERWINKNEEVYSKTFDLSDNPFELTFTPGDINLDNNISYTLTCVVAMNSGLTAEGSVQFTVSWTDEELVPDAEIGIDYDTLSAYICPYCEDENGDLVEGVLLSVYRREFDGELTELATGIENHSVYITDPHPALNYARYRIVSVEQSTGAVSYYDIPNYPVGEDAIIIQWDENWSSFDTEEETEEQPWTGSMLRLPYNIDISEKNSKDVSLVSYIGRKHPVGYYGTQIGYTSTWKVDIPETDEDTLYALRRLQNWMGDVYVREPSGTGYWANVEVSFSKNHNELKIPVTLDITRVEGGI